MNEKGYRLLKVDVPSGEAQSVADWLVKKTKLPVLEQEVSGIVRLTASLERLDGLESLLVRESVKSMGAIEATDEILPGEDWEALWKSQGFQRFMVNHWLSVIPEWDLAPKPATPFIRIHPHLAFGTGLHETTGKCLSLLVDHYPRVPAEGGRVLDFGSGTGILGIAALVLGHGDFLVAVDNDPLAVEATSENIMLNGLTGFSRTGVSPDTPSEGAFFGNDGMFRLIIANVTGGVLLHWISFLWDLLEPGGAMVLSGISTRERKSVEEIL
ncbi:MAG: 50S ribosomal protein L11 methyltransferase, partial [Leptospirillum sp.]